MNNENRENMSSSQKNMNTTQGNVQGNNTSTNLENGIGTPRHHQATPMNNGVSTSRANTGGRVSPQKNIPHDTSQGRLPSNKKNGVSSLNNASSKASQALNKLGPKGKLASKALDGLTKASSLRKKGNETASPSALKNRGFGQRIKNRFLGGSSTDEEVAESEPEDSYQEENEDSTLLGGTSKLSLFLKFLPFILPLILVFAILILIVLLVGSAIGAVSSFFSIDAHKTDNPDYVYNENNPEMLKAEQAYNDALVGSKDGSIKGIVQIYQEKYGVTLDWYLLNAVVTYRYTIVDENKMYTSDGVDSISDSELEDLIDNLESDTTGSDNSSSSEPSIDFTEAKKKIEIVAAMMVTKNGDGSYSVNNEKEGDFYNRLIDSEFLKTYYKDFLKDQEQETRKKLVDEIFDYAKLAKELLSKNTASMVASDTTQVYLQTCDTPYKKFTVNGRKLYDNPLTNEGTKYPTYLSMIDYIKGVLMAEISVSDYTESKREYVKVQAILALNFIIGDSSSGFDLKSGKMYFPTQTCRQVTCDPTYGCVSVEGKASYSGLDRGIVGRKINPLTEKENAYLDEILAEVFGLVIVNPGVTADTFSGSSDIKSINYCSNLNNTCSSCHSGSCVGQEEAERDALNGMTYKEILDKYISSPFDLINIKEGMYYESTGEYTGTVQLNENFHYHQGDSPWRSQNLCGSGAISSNGCNITSAAIAISLLTNKRVTPTDLNNRQNEIHTCHANSRPQMIMDFAKLYGLSVSTVIKYNKSDIHTMLSKLASGNFVVIARLAPNSGKYSTSGGHYIVLVGVKNENGRDKVLVWDPATSNPARDNYWADLEKDIVAALNEKYSFIVIGR